MKRLVNLWEKEKVLAIGLMSGTSLDGIDAALVEITGSGTDTKVGLLAFTTTPFSKALREKLLTTVLGKTGGSFDLCLINTLIGKLSAKACIEVCEKAGVDPKKVDFVGSHGITVYHQPEEISFTGEMARGTLQIGEGAEIAQVLGCLVVEDFRVRDVAAGGQGAPLVPYTEYLLYRQKDHTVALQNLGGIGNITLLPANGPLEKVIAFDTGPGNVLIDGAMAALTQGEKTYDNGGNFGAKGKIYEPLAQYLMKKDEDYLRQLPPKSTGREYYNKEYLEDLLLQKANMEITDEDFIATITNHTAACIAYGIEAFAPQKPKTYIVGGGGSHNKTLLAMIQKHLPFAKVQTQEALGLSSDAKEAVAFAILANETLRGLPNNAPGATGAKEPVIMGKINF